MTDKLTVDELRMLLKALDAIEEQGAEAGMDEIGPAIIAAVMESETEDDFEALAKKKVNQRLRELRQNYESKRRLIVELKSKLYRMIDQREIEDVMADVTDGDIDLDGEDSV
jgi:SOS response regulatory protein OraA/RecX